MTNVVLNNADMMISILSDNQHQPMATKRSRLLLKRKWKCRDC
jgi:hypothetical protein